ncbi:MAG: hypothetical protein HY822_22825 [Acidobacteria bacterium]|nr:hypothetical protein [Acidobacteriota bacterium]
MRAFCLTLLCCAPAWTQASYTYDLNGRRVEGTRMAAGKLGGGSFTVESARSASGRVIPLERVEERVLQQDSSTRVVERILRRFDQNGQPASVQKVRVEERKNPDGTTSTESLTWQTDVNGRYELTERARGLVRPVEGGSRSEVTVERPTLNGGMETVEKRTATERKSGTGVEQEVAAFQRVAAGGFGEAWRQVTRRSEENGRTVENAAQYEVGPSGRVELVGQRVSRTVKNADGSERSEVDLYRLNIPGRPVADQPRLREQQILERRPGAGGTVVESVSVREPAPDGSKPSGAYRKVAQRVCTGECR